MLRVPRGARLTIAAGIATVLLATSVGAGDVLAQERRNRERVRPSAATVSVQDSEAIVTVVGFDGQGTLHSKLRRGEDFQLFDRTVKFDDTDDRPRGAAAKAKQLTTIADDATSVVVKSRSNSNARYYDRQPGDGIRPDADSGAFLSITFDVAGGTGFFSLMGTITGVGSGGGSSGCGRVILPRPTGRSPKGAASAGSRFRSTRAAGSRLGRTRSKIEGSADTVQGFPLARAEASWDLSLVLSGCTIWARRRTIRT